MADIPIPQDSMIVPPEIQLARDKKSLELLLAEKADGLKKETGHLKGMKVNVSKNPEKELFKRGGINEEIARRQLIMDDLSKRITSLSIATALPPTIIAKQPDPITEQKITSYMSVIEKLKTALMPTPERNPP